MCVTGDLNSKVDYTYDFSDQDIIYSVYDDDYYCPDNTLGKTTVDGLVKRRGVKLRYLCLSSCKRIVNGRVGNKCKHTCYSHNVKSVMDYVLTEENSFQLFRTLPCMTLTKLPITPRYITPYNLKMSLPL